MRMKWTQTGRCWCVYVCVHASVCACVFGVYVCMRARVWCAVCTRVHVCACTCVCLHVVMFGTEASHTRDHLAAACPPSRARGASPGMESWCRGTSQSRELSADIQSAFALEAQGRPRKEPGELTRPPIGGRAWAVWGRKRGSGGVKTGRAEGAVLAARRRGSEQREPADLSPSERRMGCWRGETSSRDRQTRGVGRRREERHGR